ncbi:MAG: hypothetical protein EOO15_22000 [Chitinophagaceae bacterium]|nr:MAG: hypothetical protein EOO15_22000 [Chitinophagaceae bacterium]
MKRTMRNRTTIKLISIVAATIIVAACANTSPGSTSSGSIQTVANAQLRTDVMRSIGLYESATGGSRNPALISAESTGKAGASFIERWVVESNGKAVPYKVTLTPSPKGGVDFGIVRMPQ